MKKSFILKFKYKKKKWSEYIKSWNWNNSDLKKIKYKIFFEKSTNNKEREIIKYILNKI